MVSSKLKLEASEKKCEEYSNNIGMLSTEIERLSEEKRKLEKQVK